jgi:hypothetical protein
MTYIAQTRTRYAITVLLWPFLPLLVAGAGLLSGATELLLLPVALPSLPGSWWLGGIVVGVWTDWVRPARDGQSERWWVSRGPAIAILLNVGWLAVWWWFLTTGGYL